MFEKVRSIIANELGVDESQVTETADIVDDLGADSLDVVELIMELEEVFGVSVDDSEAQKMKTVGDVLKYIKKAT